MFCFTFAHLSTYNSPWNVFLVYISFQHVQTKQVLHFFKRSLPELSSLLQRAWFPSGLVIQPSLQKLLSPSSWKFLLSLLFYNEMSCSMGLFPSIILGNHWGLWIWKLMSFSSMKLIWIILLMICLLHSLFFLDLPLVAHWISWTAPLFSFFI